MEFVRALLSYNGLQQELQLERYNSFEELYVDFKSRPLSGGQHYELTLHPKQAVELEDLVLEFKMPSLSNASRLFCNAYHSASESREYGLDERLPKLSLWDRRRHLSFSADYHILPKESKASLYSWTYGYIRQSGRIFFLGSLKESMAFSRIEYDLAEGVVRFRKECKGFQLKHSFPILALFQGTGSEKEVSEAYFGQLPKARTKAPGLAVSLIRDLTGVPAEVEAAKAEDWPMDMLMVGPEYASKLGDWLDVSPKLPDGPGNLSRQLKQAGRKTGLCLLPFACEADSKVFRERKHWLLKGPDDQLVQLFYRPQPSKAVYALNFFEEEVQSYLTKVIHTVIERWGCDCLKFDLLYAACIWPTADKTRAQIMVEAMDFLRTQCGNKWIWACELPMGAAFGQVDYLQNGPTSTETWQAKNRLGGYPALREEDAVVAAFQTATDRQRVAHTLWQGASGGFSLNKPIDTKQCNQQQTNLLIQVLLSELLFTTDNIKDYSPEQFAELQGFLHWRASTNHAIKKLDGDGYRIDFQKDGKPFIAMLNLGRKAQTFRIGKSRIELEAFESLVLSSAKK